MNEPELSTHEGVYVFTWWVANSFQDSENNKFYYNLAVFANLSLCHGYANLFYLMFYI